MLVLCRGDCFSPAKCGRACFCARLFLSLLVRPGGVRADGGLRACGAQRFRSRPPHSERVCTRKGKWLWSFGNGHFVCSRWRARRAAAAMPASGRLPEPIPRRRCFCLKFRRRGSMRSSAATSSGITTGTGSISRTRSSSRGSTRCTCSRPSPPMSASFPTGRPTARRWIR